MSTQYTDKRKKAEMIRSAGYRHELKKNPQLQYLFLEITQQCNMYCRHCGSSCGDTLLTNGLSKEEIQSFLKSTAEQIDPKSIQLCITGGEPLLHPDFFEIMNFAHELGYRWGMTSNGTLIDNDCAKKLYDAGMETVSISLDGLRETHEWFRQKKNCFDAALKGIKALVDDGRFRHVQVTTVVTKKNIDELEELYQLLLVTGIRSWRVVNIEPIGRAKEQPELLLDKEDYARMFQFIKEKRFSEKMEVLYGCSHYLGPEWEGEVRPWYFLCKAGIGVASVTYNGDIVACLDIERRPELVQGNIRRDNFVAVWKNNFQIFRKDSHKCNGCKHYKFCGGDSFHTWNFEEGRPDLCMKGLLFD